MNTETFLFGTGTFVSVIVYNLVAGAAGWKQRDVIDFVPAYWNSNQAVMWALGALLLKNDLCPSILASALILPTALITGVITEQPGMTIKYSDVTGVHLNPTQIAIISVIGILYGVYLIWILITQPIKKLIPLGIFIVWLLVWFGINKASSTTTIENRNGPMYHTVYKSYYMRFYPWIAILGGFLTTVSKDPVSEAISGVLWGVFCQQAAAYGINMPSVESSTYDVNSPPQPHSPSN